MVAKVWTDISCLFEDLFCGKKSITKLDSRKSSTFARSLEKFIDSSDATVFSEKAVIDDSFATSIDVQTDPLWSTTTPGQFQSHTDDTSIHYARAQDIARKSNLTARDIEELTPKYWNFHLHDLVPVDPAATIILTIHYNLCMGTIIPFSHDRPDLKNLIDRLASFDLCGSFMLTEIGHGLDARNLETTATLQDDGTFLLHTPTNAAAKAMPPTSPKAGVSRIAVVFARLLVDGNDRGIKPFVVHLCDEDGMRPGINSQNLPFRPGSRQLDHSITTFTNVQLNAAALLGTLDAPAHPGKEFFQMLHRVAVGGLSLSMCNVPVLRHACYIAAKYSMRRYVQSSIGRVPLITFRTQSRPIVIGLAQAAVYEQYAAWVVNEFMSMPFAQARHGMVTAYKAVVTRDSQATLSELIDRCGWQGLYNHNRIIEFLLAMRGNSIAEGDVLVLCIKVATELLMEKYRLPQPSLLKSKLAMHEMGVLGEMKAKLRAGMLRSKETRYQRYNAEILPRCRMMIESIGQRMAYEAALNSGKVPPELLRVYEEHCVSMYDSSWYTENMCTTRQQMHDQYADAITAALPLLHRLVEDEKCAKYITAPILEDQQWHDFQTSLEEFKYESS